MIKAIVHALPLVVLTFALGCTPKGGGGDGGSGGPKKVKLGLNWVAEPEFGGFYAARASGAYEKQGISVEIMGGSGAPVLQMAATGQVDFGIATGDELLNARAHGADLIPVYAVYQKDPQAIMAHASRGAQTMKDVLSSGTLAMAPGVTFGAFLKKKYGFEGVSIVPYDGGVARFVADKNFAQQCFATSEPLAARKQGADPKVFLLADEGFNPYVTVVVVRRELWQKSPDVVRAFVRASREGWQSYLADPKPTNAVMAKLNTSMDAETFDAVAAEQKQFVEADDAGKRGFGAMRRERWEALGKTLVDLGMLQEAPKVDDYLIVTE